MNKRKCMICGIELDASKYEVNKAALLKVNEENNIMVCPFCGVEEKYISNDGSMYFDKIKELDERTKKILENAMKLEIFNSDYYKVAAEMAQALELKTMFSDLSKIELMHAMIHKRLAGINVLPKLNKLDYSKLDSDTLLIKNAKIREEHAIAYYNKYAAEISNIYVLEIIEALSSVEKDHIKMTNPFL